MPSKLTEATVRAAKPRDGKYEIPDALHGFRLVVQPSGAKGFVVRYRDAERRQRKVKLGDYPLLTLEAARAQAKRKLQAVARGENPAEEKRQARIADGETFNAVAHKFLEARRSQKRNRTWEQTAWMIGLIPNKDTVREGSAAARWGRKSIAEIQRRDVIALLDATAKRTPTLANRELAAIRRMFNWCLEKDLLDKSPCDGVKPPADEVERDRVLTDAELTAVWRAAEQAGQPFGPLVQLLALTGQRLREVAGMRWDEIDLERRMWTLGRTRTKTDVAHEVPLSEPALAILKGVKRIAGSPYVFTTTGAAPVSGFGKAKDRIDALAGDLPSWVFHDLRRTLASGMARLGINLPVIEKILNHSSGTFRGVVGIYQRHSFSAEKAVALEAWGRYVMSLVEERPANVVALRTA